MCAEHDGRAVVTSALAPADVPVASTPYGGAGPAEPLARSRGEQAIINTGQYAHRKSHGVTQSSHLVRSEPAWSRRHDGCCECKKMQCNQFLGGVGLVGFATGRHAVDLPALRYAGTSGGDTVAAR